MQLTILHSPSKIGGSVCAELEGKAAGQNARRGSFRVSCANDRLLIFMQKLDFTEAVEEIVARDSRFDRDAYTFLREALDFTVAQAKKTRENRAVHVSGQQLLEGLRIFALKQFGPMVVTVFDYWGIQKCEHFGEMVYHLIQTGVFGRSDSDSQEDFKGAYTFHDAFVLPFRPATAPRPRRLARREVRTIL